jgi:hypothetical protein
MASPVSPADRGSNTVILRAPELTRRKVRSLRDSLPAAAEIFAGLPEALPDDDARGGLLMRVGWLGLGAMGRLDDSALIEVLRESR